MMSEPQRPHDSLIGATFGDCCILGKIGGGTFGTVYLAEHIKLQAKRAIKVLKQDPDGPDPETLGRFLREAIAGAQINHPNVITIYDVGEIEGFNYIEMEYFEGENLKEFLERHGKIPLDRAVKLLTQITEGLSAGHSKDIVHRDIKPSNILINEHGSVKICDFGLAKMLEGGPQVSLYPRRMGSPGFMAPEIWISADFSPASDVYALGVTSYLLLTSVAPFDGDNATELMHAHLNSQPKPITDYDPDTPESVSRVVEKMLEKDKEKRSQKAVELLDDIKAIQKELDNAPQEQESPQQHSTSFFQSSTMDIAEAEAQEVGPATQSEPTGHQAKKLGDKLSAESVDQVAAVCYREKAGHAEFLLIRTSGRRWMCPKGGMEVGEPLWRVAQREAHEEAGVSGEVNQHSLTTFRHLKRDLKLQGQELTVAAFLFKVVATYEPCEQYREPTWFTPEDAQRALSEGRDFDYAEELKRVVREACLTIDAMRRNSGSQIRQGSGENAL